MKQKRLKLFTPESLARHYLHHHATLECKLQGTEKCKKAPWQRITHLHIAANGKHGKMTENETVWLMCGCESEFNWSDGEAVDLLNEWIGNGDCVAYERGEGGWVEWGMVQRKKQLDGRYMKGFKGRLKDKDREEMARARMEELELKTWSHIVAEGDEVDQKEYDRNKIAKAEVKLNKLHDEMENFVLRRRPSFRAREPKRRFYKFHFPGLL
ncbi:hypothetical protein FPQ18DRAFT_311910 [Pyronema domesticum]|nr:hypothetical protein FPQ18DRAFT_311910 [Pyronema domesticum]